MVTLAQVLLYLYPDSRPPIDWAVSVVDGLETITRWTDGMGAQPDAATIAAAQLPAAQALKIAFINAECRSRLIARYGTAEEQVSRSLGIYGAAEKAAMETGIAATIDASNAASNVVLGSTTIEQVEAVTVTWPVI